MVRYLSAVLFFAACLNLNCLGETNLAVNPGFEDSNSTAWSGRGDTFTITSEEKHSGQYSGKASNRTANWQGIRQSFLEKIKQGETYKLSAWVKLEVPNATTIIMSVEQKDDQGTNYSNLARAAISDANWVEITGTYTPNFIGTPTVLDIYFEGPPAGMNFYVDDVTVVPESAAAEKPAEPNAAPAKPAEPNAVAK